MTTATGSEHSIGRTLETVYGTTDASPVFRAMRHTGTTLGTDKDSLVSEELNSSRQIRFMRHGNESVGGDIAYELSYGTFDEDLEALLAGTWAARDAITADTIDAASADNSFNDSGSGFPIFTVGENITSSGFGTGDNNGTFVVVSSTTSKIVVSGGSLVLETAGATVTIESDEDKLLAGTTRRSFTDERLIGGIDTPKYLRFLGSEVNTMSMSVVPNAIVTGVFGMIAQSQSTPDASIISGATYSAATTTEPFDSFAGSINEGGSSIGTVTTLDFTLDNGLERAFVVGSKNTIRPTWGKSDVQGSITVFFEDTSLLEKFLGETASSLDFSLLDPAGNAYTFSFPNIKYMGGRPDTSGEGAITLNLPFQALYDSTEASNIKILRTPA